MTDNSGGGGSCGDKPPSNPLKSKQGLYGSVAKIRPQSQPLWSQAPTALVWNSEPSPQQGRQSWTELKTLALRGHTPRARSSAPRHTPQSSAATGTARRSRPGRREAGPEACVELGPGRLRESASRESKGRRGPGLGVPGTSSRVAGPPNRAASRPLPRHPKRGRWDRRRHRGQSPGSPTSPDQLVRVAGGWGWEGWAGLPGELSPPSL